MAGSAKKPTQNSFVRASLGQATQPRVPQPSLSNCGPRHPGLSCSLFCSKESDLPGGKLEAFENPPVYSYSHRIHQLEGWRGSGRGVGAALWDRRFPPQWSCSNSLGAACLFAPTALLGGERREVPEGRCRGTAVEGSGCRRCWERNGAAGGGAGRGGGRTEAQPGGSSAPRGAFLGGGGVRCFQREAGVGGQRTKLWSQDLSQPRGPECPERLAPESGWHR